MDDILAQVVKDYPNMDRLELMGYEVFGVCGYSREEDELIWTDLGQTLGEFIDDLCPDDSYNFDVDWVDEDKKEIYLGGFEVCEE